MAKEIKYSTDARNAMAAGVDKLANTVKDNTVAQGQKRGSGQKIHFSHGLQTTALPLQRISSWKTPMKTWARSW